MPYNIADAAKRYIRTNTSQLYTMAMHKKVEIKLEIERFEEANIDRVAIFIIDKV